MGPDRPGLTCLAITAGIVGFTIGVFGFILVGSILLMALPR